MNKYARIPLLLIVLVFCFSCTKVDEYHWPAAKVADSTLVDSLNAAYSYELAENLLAWDETKSPMELLKLIDTLYQNPNPQLIGEVLDWLEENRRAVDALVEGSNKPYCDFSFGHPRPYRTHEDKYRKYPKLWNVTDLVLFKAWHYYQIDEPDSALYMISSVTRVLSHLENQLDGVIIAKLVEVLSLQHVARSLKYAIDQSQDVDHLRKIYRLTESYLENRNSMDDAMSEQLFLRIDFKEQAEEMIRETIGKFESMVDSLDTLGVLDSLDTDIDFQKINFQSIDIDQSAEEVAYFAEQEYLKGMYPVYQSYSKAFKENDPLLVEISKSKYGLTWFALKLSIRMLFLDPENPKVPTRTMGQVVGRTMSQVAQPDFRAYINDCHMIEAELRIVLKASQLKLSKISGEKLKNVEDMDPFNRFKPLKIIRTVDKFVVYSYGPDKQDGKGLKLDTYRGSEQDWSGRDLGYLFTW